MSGANYHLTIKADGMCTSLGYSGMATACALRAGMDMFQRSDFQAGAGNFVRVARLPDEELWGASRLSEWMTYAMQDCLQKAIPLKDPELVVLVLGPAEKRPGAQTRQALDALLKSRQALGISLHKESKVFYGGRAGLAEILTVAKNLLLQNTCKQVMLLGADSLLGAETINYYLKQKRLLIHGNSDGFIPGEAAAAVLLELAPVKSPGLHILGWGHALEEGRPDGSVPSRAKGLTQAIRTAFEQAGRNCNDLSWRLSDQNGEAFFAREAAHALTRVAEKDGTLPATLTTADCVGEIGGATGPLMLAYLGYILPRQDGPGYCGLIHLANDGGRRNAIVVEYQPPQGQAR